MRSRRALVRVLTRSDTRRPLQTEAPSRVGSLAPVMIVTASDIVCVSGEITAARFRMCVNAISHLEHVRHLVADQDDREATIANVFDQCEDATGLLHAQGRGRLIHDDDPGGERGCAGNGHTLALATRQRLDRWPMS